MNIHKNARVTPKSRAELVRRVMQGQLASQVALAFGVSAKTVAKWVGRFRAEGEIGLQDRSSATAPSTIAADRKGAASLATDHPAIHINVVATGCECAIAIAALKHITVSAARVTDAWLSGRTSVLPGIVSASGLIFDYA